MKTTVKTKSGYELDVTKIVLARLENKITLDRYREILDNLKDEKQGDTLYISKVVGDQIHSENIIPEIPISNETKLTEQAINKFGTSS